MAAASNYVKQCRSWNFDDSLEQSDVERLFEPESTKVTKPVRCIKYWSLYATICVFFALFLLGLLVGFYVRDDQKVQIVCDKRKDGFDKEKIQAVHNNIVYSMSGDKLIEYVRELSPLSKEQLDLWDEDQRTAKIVEREFLKFGFDHVAVEEYNVVVTSPDPAHPNRLEILYPGGSAVHNVSYGIGKGDNLLIDRKQLAPFMAFSSAGEAEGPLVYGEYGTAADFLTLQDGNTSLHGALALLKIGQTPVSEKVQIAKSFGVVGLLLFCEEDSYHGNSCQDNQDVSWEDFKGQDGITYSLPVQTVSLELATELLKNVSRNGTSLERRKINDTIQSRGIKDGRSSVRVQINNKLVSKTVCNVIGTITGSDEPDRMVLVGAGRQGVASLGEDRVSSTAILMELGRSLTYIRAAEGWEPQRTIRLVSWGGHEWSRIGLLNHLKDHSQTLDSEAVSYIDLDLQRDSRDTMQYQASPSLEKLVQMAATMIPDPFNPDTSLSDSWPQYDKASYAQDGHLPIMHQLGIPSVVIQKVQARDEEVQDDTAARDITHHFKNHLATARVASLMLIQLSDFAQLPVDVEFFTEFVKELVTTSLESLKQLVPDDKIASLQATLTSLAEAGQRFPSRTPDCALLLKTREINDALMRLEKMFIHTVASNRFQLYQYILQRNIETGTLFVLSEALKTYKVTGNIKPVWDIVDIIDKAVEEVTQELTVLGS